LRSVPVAETLLSCLQRGLIMITQNRPQYYVFESAGNVCIEGFDDLGHWAAPSPFTSVESALRGLKRQHPAAIVDSLLYAADIAEASALALSGAVL
jgi:hypothetical protein